MKGGRGRGVGGRVNEWILSYRETLKPLRWCRLARISNRAVPSRSAMNPMISFIKHEHIDKLKYQSTEMKMHTIPPPTTASWIVMNYWFHYSIGCLFFFCFFFDYPQPDQVSSTINKLVELQGDFVNGLKDILVPFVPPQNPLIYS